MTKSFASRWETSLSIACRNESRRRIVIALAAAAFITCLSPAFGQSTAAGETATGENGEPRVSLQQEHSVPATHAAPGGPGRSAGSGAHAGDDPAADQARRAQLETLLRTPATERKADDPVPPSHVVYRFFFHHLANLDELAAKREAAGKDGEAWRTHDQKVARLTAQEGEVLKRVAYACNQALAEQDQRISAALAAWRRQDPDARSRHATLPPELAQLWAGRAEIVDSHVEQLRALLGEASFKKLDGYVQGNFRPAKQALTAPAQPPAPSSGRRTGR